MTKVATDFCLFFPLNTSNLIKRMFWNFHFQIHVFMVYCIRRQWVREEDLAKALKLHSKQLRRTLRFFEEEKLITREHRKEVRFVLVDIYHNFHLAVIHL